MISGGDGVSSVTTREIATELARSLTPATPPTTAESRVVNDAVEATERDLQPTGMRASPDPSLLTYTLQEEAVAALLLTNVDSEVTAGDLPPELKGALRAQGFGLLNHDNPKAALERVVGNMERGSLVSTMWRMASDPAAREFAEIAIANKKTEETYDAPEKKISGARPLDIARKASSPEMMLKEAGKRGWALKPMLELYSKTHPDQPRDSFPDKMRDKAVVQSGDGPIRIARRLVDQAITDKRVTVEDRKSLEKQVLAEVTREFGKSKMPGEIIDIGANQQLSALLKLGSAGAGPELAEAAPPPAEEPTP